MNYDDLEGEVQQSVDMIAYYYGVISTYADYQEITPTYLEEENGRMAGILSMLFKRHGIETLPYHHYQETLDLVDNWIKDRTKDTKRLKAIKGINDSLVNSVNTLLDAFEEGAIVKKGDDYNGAPLVVVSQTNIAPLISEIRSLDRKGYHSSEFRQIVKQKIDEEMKNIERQDFNTDNEFGLKYLKGLDKNG